MTSLTTTTIRCPNSFQLRLALDCRNCPSLLVRMRVQKLDSKVRMFCGSNGAERRRKGNSWMNSSSSVDAFSGWSDKDGNDNEESTQPPKKQWFEGIVGARVAGVVLIAGLTFATLSMSNRASRSKQQMEPLTSHVEESLDSADQNETVENERNGSTDANAMLHNFSQESKTGIGEDSSSYAENNESTNENKRSHDTDVDYASDGGDAIDSTQQDLQNESAIDEIPVAPMGGTPKLSESEVPGGPSVASSFEDSDGNLVAERIELSTESKENPIDDNPLNFNIDHKEVVPGPGKTENSNFSVDSSSNSFDDTPKEPIALKISLNSQLDAVIEPQVVNKEDMETVISLSNIEDVDLNKMPEVVVEGIKSSLELHNLNGGGSLGTTSVSALAYPFADKQSENVYDEVNGSRSFFDSMNSGNFSSSAGIPAPSVVSPALKALPGKVLVPAVIDQVQGQALAALQVLKVIEADVQPGDLCTRREYARWLVSASSALSRNSVSKVYPAMFIENVTELGFDDITPEDPDFPSIQGLAEAGLIASKLSRRDMSSSLDEDESSLFFCPESPLSRQDLVSWKMSLEKKQLPVADRKILQELSGFIDVDRINPDAWPALLSDLSAGEQGITALAFGYTRLFQPDKPVTKAQAAIALATGEASDLVSEELARIEAESIAEKAVAAHSALVDQVEKDVNASFEKELMLEREKIDAVEKMAEEARRELERLRAEREEENMVLMKERAAVDSEMEVLSRLRREVEEQLQGLMSNKVEISYEKERISKLRKDAETENQEIAKLQYDLEVERKALSMARSWAEEEAKRAKEQAKVLEEARGRWEKHGIKVVVDDDLREEANATDTWVTAGTHFSVEGTVDRAENLVDKLKAMATDVKGKSQNTINKLIQKILSLISMLKEWAFKVGKQAGEMKDGAVSKVVGSLQELQQSSAEFSLTVKQGAKRVAGDCKEGVEKLTQKFKT